MARIKVEFHCHTNYSTDSLLKVPDLEAAMKKAGVNKVVITDHNTIQGALMAKKTMPDCVIVGEEVEVTYKGLFAGEIIAMFVSKEVSPNQDVFEVIKKLRDQGAFIAVSHPCDRMRVRWSEAMLEEVLPLVDGVEVFNSRCLVNDYNLRADQLAKKMGLPGFSGSDAHTSNEIGKSHMIMDDFLDANEMCRALESAIHVKRKSPWFVHLLSRYARLQSKNLPPCDPTSRLP